MYKMCGIWLYIKNKAGQLSLKEIQAFQNVSPRGPESTKLLQRDRGRLNVGFHRLAILDTTDAGNEPFVTSIGDVTYITVCNGELYNYKQLADEYEFKSSLTSECDIEIIPHLIHRVGLEKTCSLLDGVFAFCVINEKTKTVLVGRDTFGVRPLFYAKYDGEIAFSSLLKGIPPRLQKYASQFPPSHCQQFAYSTRSLDSNLSMGLQPLIRWNSLLEKANQVECLNYPKGGSLDTYARKIRELLIEAVHKRLQSDRPVCVLLSGGLDSSLITSIICRLLPPGSPKVKTFSVGMSGSTDLKFARKTADFLGTDHSEAVFSKEDFLKQIPNIVREIESYDTLSVRGSTCNYLIGKYIRENSDYKVVLNGEGSDEVFMSYLYAKNAPTKEDFHREGVRLLNDIHYFDVLRSDRTISCHGLESRTPFLDKEFVKYVLLNVPIAFRCHPTIEKHILRYAFDDSEQPFLPNDVLWRRKEAFSDGVSSTTDSWHSVIHNYILSNLNSSSKKIDNHTGNPSNIVVQETAWYYNMFQEIFPECEKVIPYYWMPKWCGDVSDPSARALSTYDGENNN